MEVILLEAVGKLGKIGDVVRVKDGFGRNFLIPKKKALRATKSNREFFDEKRAQIEQEYSANRSEAQQIASKMEGLVVDLIRQAGEDGKLFGSVTARDIAVAISGKGYAVERAHVMLDIPIKYVGMHTVSIALYSDVKLPVTVNVARTEDEAATAAAGQHKAENAKAEETAE